MHVAGIDAQPMRSCPVPDTLGAQESCQIGWSEVFAVRQRLANAMASSLCRGGGGRVNRCAQVEARLQKSVQRRCSGQHFRVESLCIMKQAEMGKAALRQFSIADFVKSPPRSFGTGTIIG